MKTCSLVVSQSPLYPRERVERVGEGRREGRMQRGLMKKRHKKEWKTVFYEMERRRRKEIEMPGTSPKIPHTFFFIFFHWVFVFFFNKMLLNNFLKNCPLLTITTLNAFLPVFLYNLICFSALALVLLYANSLLIPLVTIMVLLQMCTQGLFACICLGVCLCVCLFWCVCVCSLVHQNTMRVCVHSHPVRSHTHKPSH